MDNSEQKPNQDIPSVRAAFVYITTGSSVLMVQEGGKLARGLWSFPGGHLNDGETFEVAAIRETREESGLEAALGETIFRTIIPAAEYKGSPEDTGLVEVVIFKAEITGGQLALDNEAMDLKWLEKSESLNLPHRWNFIKKIIANF